MSQHTGDFKHKCDSCGKGFNTKALMDEHCNIHTGETPYQ
jgi:hypothetical protein